MILNFFNTWFQGEATEGRQRKRAFKKVQDKRAVLRKRARRKNARQKSVNQLGLLGLLYFIIHFRHVSFPL